jgi:DNA recombination protein RmuC
MGSHVTIISAAILAVVIGIFWLVWRIRRAVRTERDIDTDQLSSAISESWRRMGLDQTVGQLETHVDDMRQFHGDIATMLRNPQERGEFGEQQLDVLLSDHLPPEMYGIRRQVVDGKAPDAHIQSTSGVICIDSKFPLDNYEQFVEAEDPETRAEYRRLFRRDVESQLEKIATDYVRPSEGTADFAFAFIPSESVYYHLISEEYDLLREYTKSGVQVVSPLTLGHKLELIKADVQAQKLSEQASEILERLEDLGARFEDLEDDWETLYRHISNSKNKADDVERGYENLRAAFDRIEQPELSGDED